MTAKSIEIIINHFNLESHMLTSVSYVKDDR